ncbi:MAG TPA: MlaD family protein, partial [Plasticicumulans sp.]|nr:MlaD family protein [Plasticicumulans sp.]
MNPSRTVEVLVGAFVMLGLAALVFLAMQVSGLTSLGADAAYRVHARFENVGGLKVRSPVSMAGVRIGRVTAIDIDPQTFQAVVE